LVCLPHPVPQRNTLHRHRPEFGSALRATRRRNRSTLHQSQPPRRLLTKFACPNQSVAGRLEAPIKNLAANDKKKLIDKTSAEVRKALLH